MNKEKFISACIDVDEFLGDKMPLMACEDAGKLIRAISKHERTCNNGVYNDYTKSQLIKEIGDMYISLIAIMSHYNINMSEVDEVIEENLGRKY